MENYPLGYLREARAALLEESETFRSREISVALTHIDTAILWMQEDIRLKTPILNEVEHDLS